MSSDNLWKPEVQAKEIDVLLRLHSGLHPFHGLHPSTVLCLRIAERNGPTSSLWNSDGERVHVPLAPFAGRTRLLEDHPPARPGRACLREPPKSPFHPSTTISANPGVRQATTGLPAAIASRATLQPRSARLVPTQRPHAPKANRFPLADQRNARCPRRRSHGQIPGACFSPNHPRSRANANHRKDA